MKLSDIFGYILFILFLIIGSPYLFISGGIVRIIRFYGYVKNKVHDKIPNKYYY